MKLTRVFSDSGAKSAWIVSKQPKLSKFWRSMRQPSRWFAARLKWAKKSAPMMGCLTSAMIKLNGYILLPKVTLCLVEPKHGMDVPFAAESLVPLGPFFRCTGRGGSIERIAPPSTSHLILVFGSRMYRRSPFPDSRDAAEFMSVVPLSRFPLTCCLVVAS